nr:PH10-36 [Vibrio phage 1]
MIYRLMIGCAYSGLAYPCLKARSYRGEVLARFNGKA